MGLTERRIGLLFAIFLSLLLIAALARDLARRRPRSDRCRQSPARSRSRSSRCRRGAARSPTATASSSPSPSPPTTSRPRRTSSRSRSRSRAGSRRCWARRQAKRAGEARREGRLRLPVRNLPGREVERRSRSSRSPGCSSSPARGASTRASGWPRRCSAGSGSTATGLAGLEYARDKVLRGSDGQRRIVKDALGEPIVLQETQRAEPGKDLQASRSTPSCRARSRTSSRRSA